MMTYSFKWINYSNNTHYLLKFMGIKGSKANLSQKTTRAHFNGITRSSC